MDPLFQEMETFERKLSGLNQNDREELTILRGKLKKLAAEIIRSILAENGERPI